MKNNISQEQIDFYRENGFVLIESFLNDDELSSWRKAVAHKQKMQSIIKNTLWKSFYQHLV